MSNKKLFVIVIAAVIVAAFVFRKAAGITGNPLDNAV